MMIDAGGAGRTGFGFDVRRAQESVDSERLKPILVAALLFFALPFTAVRFDQLLGWNGSLVDVGPVLVRDACAEAGSLRSPVWECQATVIGPIPVGAGRTLDTADSLRPAGPSTGAVDGSSDGEPSVVAATGQAVTLVLPRSGRLAERPHLGLEVDVFARRAAVDVVYPQSSRLPEVTRLYLSLLARIALLTGAALWFFGWFLERRLRPVDGIDALNQSIRSRPDVWRSRGVLWLTIGVAFSAINIFIIERLIGSLGVA